MFILTCWCTNLSCQTNVEIFSAHLEAVNTGQISCKRRTCSPEISNLVCKLKKFQESKFSHKRLLYILDEPDELQDSPSLLPCLPPPPTRIHTRKRRPSKSLQDHPLVGTCNFHSDHFLNVPHRQLGRFSKRYLMTTLFPKYLK